MYGKVLVFIGLMILLVGYGCIGEDVYCDRYSDTIARDDCYLKKAGYLAYHNYPDLSSAEDICVNRISKREDECYLLLATISARMERKMADEDEEYSMDIMKPIQLCNKTSVMLHNPCLMKVAGITRDPTPCAYLVETKVETKIGLNLSILQDICEDSAGGS